MSSNNMLSSLGLRRVGVAGNAFDELCVDTDADAGADREAVGLPGLVVEEGGSDVDARPCRKASRRPMVKVGSNASLKTPACQCAERRSIPL